MTKELIESTLRELPIGSPVKYLGNSRLKNCIGVKVADYKRVMVIVLDGVRMPVRYKKLTCDKVETSIAVAQRLIGDKNPELKNYYSHHDNRRNCD